MANEANADFSITFLEQTKYITEEIMDVIKAKAPFFDGEVSFKDDTISVGCACRWSGDGLWDWLDRQMDGDTSDLSEAARTALIGAKITGSSYEYGTAYRDKIEKDCGEESLDISYVSYDEMTLADALIAVDADKLNIGATVDYVTLDDVTEGSDGTKLYSFTVSGCLVCRIGLLFKDGCYECTTFLKCIVDDGIEEDFNMDKDEYDGDNMCYMTELIDDIVRDCKSVYT